MLDHIVRSIDNAEKGISKLSESLLDLDGMSSSKIRHFLNNIVDINDARYLEIGTWKGSTVCSALYNNQPELAVAMDNFSEFNGPREEFKQNIQKYITCNNFHFFDVDCFQFDLSQISQQFNIYLYDGEHSESSHELALSYYYNKLENTFIYLCDDWNDKSVAAGTRKAFSNLNLKVIREWTMPASYNGDKTNWWNGFYISLIQK